MAKLLHFLKNHQDQTQVLVFCIALILSIVVLITYISNLQRKIVTTTALESAKFYSLTLAKFRTVYTSEVVRRVNAHPDFSITHDYTDKKYAIPLPATLSMSLGEEIGKLLDGAHTHLYSAYPFPWRQETGGLNDSFRRQAWQALRTSPALPYYAFTEYNGRPVLRYASADLMREDCVNCHNNHPDTPRKGWQAGDLRGVLEIIHPMKATVAQTEEGTRGMAILAGAIVVFGVFWLTMLFHRFNATKMELEERVAARTHEIKVVEKQLAETKKMAAIGEISSGIAHEINQPLGSIKLTLSSLLTALERGDAQKTLQRANRIDTQVDRIDKIITQLNAYHHGSAEQVCELVCVDELVGNALEQMSNQLAEHGVTPSVTLATDMPLISGDITALERVLVNLLMNSLQAMENKKNKNLEIATRVFENEVQIAVSDNGVGIPAHVIDKVFDPFFTTKSVGKGTGLGLSLCYGIAKQHHGKLSVETQPGSGTCFTLTIPIHPGSEGEKNDSYSIG